MKKYVFESLKFFCAAILCTILSAFTSPSWGACNMFHIEPQTLNGVTLTMRDDGAYVLNGTCNYNGNFLLGPQSLGAGTYTLALIDRELAPDMAGTQVQAYSQSDIGTNMVVKMDSGENYVTRTFDTDYNDVLFRIRIQEGITYDNYVIKPMFVKGATVPTEYTPYDPLCATCDGTIVNYTSATGTGVQNGTPTPTNPIEPTFYKQGNMVLRKVGDYADSYDATTGKITRKVGVKVFDGTEASWYEPNTNQRSISKAYLGMVPSGTTSVFVTHYPSGGAETRDSVYVGSQYVNFIVGSQYTMEQWKQYLAQQYANGTPVTIYYPLAEETTEDWPASYCETPIKIATTKYNESAFSPLNTALQNAISVVDTVVSNTITQAGRIATLQTQKQTRPNDIADDNEKCPAGKKCLLVTDTSGIPHWYEIVEQYSLLPDGYTELEYIQTDGNSWINTGYIPNGKPTIKTKLYATALGTQFWGCRWTPAPTYDTLGAIVGSGGNLTIYYGLYGNEEFTAFSDYRTGVVHTFELGESSIIYDGLTTNISRENISSTYSFVVGGFNNNGEINQTGISRIYSMEVKESGNMMLNLIPAKNASGVVGMYDTVSGTFFTNAGTGEFIAGDQVAE